MCADGCCLQRNGGGLQSILQTTRERGRSACERPQTRIRRAQQQPQEQIRECETTTLATLTAAPSHDVEAEANEHSTVPVAREADDVGSLLDVHPPRGTALAARGNGLTKVGVQLKAVHDLTGAGHHTDNALPGSELQLHRLALGPVAGVPAVASLVVGRAGHYAGFAAVLATDAPHAALALSELHARQLRRGVLLEELGDELPVVKGRRVVRPVVALFQGQWFRVFWIGAVHDAEAELQGRGITGRAP
mmetsp:Transcript_42793/g.96610  ORF Transcript_42793/g.96610 Transcript_42793/m.96610 type:complete len:249 (+) Transcript_42793:84-830(+)